MLGLAAKLLGSLALIIVIAAVFRVVMTNLWEADTSATPVSPIVANEAEPPTPQPPAATPSLPPPPAPAAPAEPAPLPQPETVPTPPAAPSKPASTVEVTSLPRAVPVQPQVSPPPPLSPSGGIESIESKRPQIDAVLRAYFAADTPEKLLPWVRDPQRVQSQITAYTATYPLQPLDLKELGWVRSVAEPGFRFGYIQALFEKAPPVSIIVEELADGRIVVDWESAVRYGEMTWREFIDRRPTQPTLLRVLVSRRSVPAPGTSAIDPNIPLEIHHASDSTALVSQAASNDARLASLWRQLEAGQWKNVPVTLRLSFPTEAAQPNEVQIASVEGRGWLIVPEPTR